MAAEFESVRRKPLKATLSAIPKGQLQGKQNLPVGLLSLVLKYLFIEDNPHCFLSPAPRSPLLVRR